MHPSEFIDDVNYTPHQMLAARVLQQAVFDAQGGDQWSEEFLTGNSESLGYWLSLLEVEVEVFHAIYARQKSQRRSDDGTEAIQAAASARAGNPRGLRSAASVLVGAGGEDGEEVGTDQGEMEEAPSREGAHDALAEAILAIACASDPVFADVGGT